MKNKTQNIVICVLTFVTIVLGIYVFLITVRMSNEGSNWKICVPNADTAVNIAQLVCKSYTGMDVELEAFIPEYDAETDIWKVRIKSRRDFDSTYSSWFDQEHAIYIEGGDATVLKASINTSAVEKYYKIKDLYE